MSKLTLMELEAIAGPHGTRQASEVKANWRAIVQEAQKHVVIVTNYNRPEAVVLSVEQYVKLKAEARANDPLARLREEWDRQMAVMQEPGARERTQEWFGASPEEIADAVNKK